MGRAVIGGIITSTLLTLVVVPVLYTYLDAWGRRIKARIATKDAEHAGAGGGAKPVAAAPESD
jgi:predicted PurR-regulated permease PerM